MSLGDLRKFLSSIDNVPDESEVKARVTFRKQLRSITIDDDDVGFKSYVGADDADADEEFRAKVKSK